MFNKILGILLIGLVISIFTLGQGTDKELLGLSILSLYLVCLITGIRLLKLKK